jgi:hypothetical protein
MRSDGRVLTDVEPAELVFYCRRRTAREFGGD